MKKFFVFREKSYKHTPNHKVIIVSIWSYRILHLWSSLYGPSKEYHFYFFIISPELDKAFFLENNSRNEGFNWSLLNNKLLYFTNMSQKISYSE